MAADVVFNRLWWRLLAKRAMQFPAMPTRLIVYRLLHADRGRPLNVCGCRQRRLHAFRRRHPLQFSGTGGALSQSARHAH